MAMLPAGATRLDVMNFLNEVASDFPRAVSFASGRPRADFFDLSRWMAGIDRFVDHVAAKEKIAACAARGLVSQYGRTNGIIQDLVTTQLSNDEGISATPDRIVVTVGCQEAIALAMTVLCAAPGDVLLVRNPTYIGATGLADLLGIEVRPVEGPGAIDPVTHALAREGKRARAVYVTPEFDNPTGAVLPRAERDALVAECAEKRIVVLEDNPYGMFRFEGDPSVPLSSLDTRGAVIYLGTYSKTLCPALRVGFMVVPERLFGDAAASRALLTRLSTAKSFVTVNTSQIMQAVVGGVLLAEGGTLARIVEPARAFYRANRDVMLDALSSAFAGTDVTWNRPQGGFFLTLRLPFAFGRAEVEVCAREHDVLVMPMSFFALGGAHDREVRVAFSNVSPEEIPIGVERFAAFVRARQ